MDCCPPNAGERNSPTTQLKKKKEQDGQSQKGKAQAGRWGCHAEAGVVAGQITGVRASPSTSAAQNVRPERLFFL